MQKVELAKTIEAKKLNKKTHIPLDNTWHTIPFGAILVNPEVKDDKVEFMYLEELYECAYDDVKQSLARANSQAGGDQAVAVGPKPASEPATDDQPMLRWERLRSNQDTMRVKVPGGWLVSVGGSNGNGMTFYPDPDHSWDGLSLP